MENTKQSRWRSWPMWAGIAGAAWVLLSAVGIPQKFGLTNDTYNTVFNAAGTILILLGVVNNPTDSQHI